MRTAEKCRGTVENPRRTTPRAERSCGTLAFMQASSHGAFDGAGGSDRWVPWRRWLAAAGMALCALQPACAETITVVTEEYPPYNFTEDGKLTGLCTDVVQAVLQHLKIEGRFQVLPWARAYESAQAQENVLIYSITRTPEREKLFKWMGPLASIEWYLFGRPDRHLQLDTLDDARKLQVGTVNADVGEQFLQGRGFALGKQLQSSNRHETNYEKLRAGRLDLWIMNESSASHIARRAGDDPQRTLEKTLRLPELASGTYMAFGPKTSDALVARFRAGLDAIRADGTYEALQKKWR